MHDNDSQLKRWWNRLTRRQQTQVVQKQDRRADRVARRRASRAALAGGQSGYCCPKCHTWHATPEKRAKCRAEHRRAAEAAAAREAVAA